MVKGGGGKKDIKVCVIHRNICLLQKYDGSFLNVIKKAEKSAKKLLELLVQEFPSLRDTAQFEGKTGRYQPPL